MRCYSGQSLHWGLTTLLVLTALCVCPSLASVQAILIQGGTVVNADRQWMADVLIQGELIQQVAPGIVPPAGVRIIDASGSFVMPGGIDPHTHLSMPFMGQVSCDDFFTGQSAALAGGTTMHIDFALPVEHNLSDGLEAWKVKAKEACMDYGFHMAITRWNSQTAADMEQLTMEGINSFKFFMAYKGALMVNDAELLAGFAACKRLGALPMVHAENGEGVEFGRAAVFNAGITRPEGHALSRPSLLEGEATGRAIRLAALAGSPLYVVHVTSADALDEVAKARAAGQRVIGEPLVGGVALDDTYIRNTNFTVAAQYVMSPPIRGAQHREALKKALAGGVLSVVATDHCPWTSMQKAAGKHDFRIIPNGVNGIEERMHVVWQEMVNSGLLTPSEYVAATSTAAAQAFNIYPRKGVLAAGSDADIIILDPRIQHTLSAATHHSAINTNVYEGWKVQGKVVTTISRGRIVWQDGQLQVSRGTGRFVHTPVFGPIYQGLDLLQAGGWGPSDADLATATAAAATASMTERTPATNNAGSTCAACAAAGKINSCKHDHSRQPCPACAAAGKAGSCAHTDVAEDSNTAAGGKTCQQCAAAGRTGTCMDNSHGSDATGADKPACSACAAAGKHSCECAPSPESNGSSGSVTSCPVCAAAGSRCDCAQQLLCQPCSACAAEGRACSCGQTDAASVAGA